jgi:hypothetical protein
MSTLGRRVDRLEEARPRPSAFDALDPILAGLSTSELIDLVRHIDAVREPQGPTAEQQAVYGRVRDRLALVGIALP